MEDYILINDMFNKHYQSNDGINWYEISRYEDLSEDFIEKYSDKLDWRSITIYQCLSEKLIEKYSNKISWDMASKYQYLSEKIIEENKNKVEWDLISKYQKLSEEFIEKYEDKLNWVYISKFQKLSENFIKRFKEKLFFLYISKYQKLSESFIKQFNIFLYFNTIFRVQKLSSDFINNFEYLGWDKDTKNQSINDNWIYKSTDEKKKAVIDTGKYECYDDYFIAYKAIRPDRYSLFNFQYKYEKGGIYETWCDCSDEEDSFGFGAGTEQFAKTYGLSTSRHIIIRCKIRYEDVGRIVRNGEKIRCFKVEALD